MKNRYFYAPLIGIIVLTTIVALFAYSTDPASNPLRSSLLVNLLASGITVVSTALLIDRSIRNERKQDSRPGLNYVNKILTQELEYFFQNVGYMKDALDAGSALGSTLDLSKRDLKAEYEHGLRTAKSVTTKTFTGTHKNTAGWIYHPTERLLETLDEVLSSFNYVISYSDLTKLYKLKKEMSSSLTQIKQSLYEEFDIAEGYYSTDEGYISNRDYTGDKLSSLKAYYINRIIKLALEIEKIKLKSPST